MSDQQNPQQTNDVPVDLLSLEQAIKDKPKRQKTKLSEKYKKKRANKKRRAKRWAAFKSRITPRPERAVIFVALAVTVVFGVWGVNVAMSIPTEAPASVATVDAPIVPTVVKTESFHHRRDIINESFEAVPPQDPPDVPAVPKSKQKNKKRSSADDGSYQLASLGNVSVGEIEARPVTLNTPFGVDIKTRVSLAGISPRILGYLRKLQAECGAVTVISGVRSTGVPGTCHRGGNAVDIQIADHVCALRYARNWSGGHSTDYYGVQAISRGMPAHFHVSSCGREMGVRFVHRGSSGSSVRSARRSRAKQTRVARARVKSTVRRTQAEKPYWTKDS